MLNYFKFLHQTLAPVFSNLGYFKQKLKLLVLFNKFGSFLSLIVLSLFQYWMLFSILEMVFTF